MKKELQLLVEQANQQGLDFIQLCEEAFYGEGYTAFFQKAFDDLEKEIVVSVPEKWEDTPNGARYTSLVEIM